MKATVKGIPPTLISTYNAFVDVCNLHSLTFTDIKINIGEGKDGTEGLIIEMELSNGLTNQKASEIFRPFLTQYPNNYLSYNIEHVSTIERQLRSKAQTVIELSKGFKLDKIQL